MVIDHFMYHVSQTHGTETFCCSQCKQTIRVAQARLHFRMHSIGDYQCLLCSFGEAQLDQLTNHMSIKHPEKYQFVGVRKYRKSFINKTVRVKQTQIYRFGLKVTTI